MPYSSLKYQPMRNEDDSLKTGKWYKICYFNDKDKHHQRLTGEEQKH